MASAQDTTSLFLLLILFKLELERSESGKSVRKCVPCLSLHSCFNHRTR